MIPQYCPRCGTELAERRVEGRTRRVCTACERTVYRNAVPCADLAVVADGRVLLVQRAVAPDRGSWTIPGGHLEFEEEPRTGAVRELEEETGLVVDPGDLALVEATQLEPIGAKRVVSVAYAVARDATTGDPVPGSDADAVDWVGLDGLADRDCRPQVERRVRGALAAVGDGDA